MLLTTSVQYYGDLNKYYGTGLVSLSASLSLCLTPYPGPANPSAASKASAT
jgi:hypothetical protein